MVTGTTPSIVNLLGFITGVVLYVMLLWMVLTSRPSSNRLALLTGVLGFAWNAGAFGGYGLLNLGFTMAAPLLLAAAFSALCFLPSVVVHSALRTTETIPSRQNLLIAVTAYGMSSAATVMHFYSAITTGAVPSQIALRGVTVGFAGLLLILLIVTRGREGRGRILWVVAMSVFAVSALHLSYHQSGGDDSWWLQLAGHHASLPLALLILYEDFRFALADIFLKRALAFLLLAGLTFAVFVFGVSPLLAAQPSGQETTTLLLAMWVSTALLYPSLRRVAGWFVDKVVLKRVDYAHLLGQLSHDIDGHGSPPAILDELTRVLAAALSAKSIEWTKSAEPQDAIVLQQNRRGARVGIATTERPQYVLNIRDLAGGRRLLSDDLAMLERAAWITARRIDAVRALDERYRHDVQEQEMRKLAAEAELRALRAQINPHFLFNALTTIGYLIQTAPERALETLMRLSGLMRGVLKSADEFVPLGEELDLVEAYLDIERARFEDRLQVHIDVPWELRSLRIPALVIQPLVENSIKHGISECVSGGEVRISARLHESTMIISVADTGLGVNETALARRQSRGLGLSNVKQRLERYGSTNAVSLRSTPGLGTTAEVRIRLNDADAVTAGTFGDFS
jgi:hypothetical protein